MPHLLYPFVIQVFTLTSNDEEAEVERFYEDLQDLLELTPRKEVLFIIGDWNAKVGSQDIPGVTANLALEYRMFFAAKDGEALYSQQKQDQELTMAEIMNSLLPNSD